MYRRSSKKPKRPSDSNLLARQIVEESIGEPLAASKIVAFPIKETAKNPAAVALGRLGGLKGGKARAEKLTAEQRRKIAQQAALARWATKPSNG